MQPWIADFRITVAPDIFFLAVFLDFGGFLLLLTFSELLGVFLFFLLGRMLLAFPDFFWVGLGMVLTYFVLPTPPAQCRGWSG